MPEDGMNQGPDKFEIKHGQFLDKTWASFGLNLPTFFLGLPTLFFSLLRMKILMNIKIDIKYFFVYLGGV